MLNTVNSIKYLVLRLSNYNKYVIVRRGAGRCAARRSNLILYSLIITCLFLISCSSEQKPVEQVLLKDSVAQAVDSIEIKKEELILACALVDTMLAYGMLSLDSLKDDIVIDLKYSSEDNFAKQDLYGCIEQAFVNPETFQKLKIAIAALKELKPSHKLIIYDAARPSFVQYILWDSIKGRHDVMQQYVSNPAKGSLHNYGAALDISIVDSVGNSLDMGTPFDFFGEAAFTDRNEKLLQSGKLNQTQIANRQLLRKVMYSAGFFGIQSEWWHFNACTKVYAAAKFRRIP